MSGEEVDESFRDRGPRREGQDERFTMEKRRRNSWRAETGREGRSRVEETRERAVRKMNYLGEFRKRGWFLLRNAGCRRLF